MKDVLSNKNIVGSDIEERIFGKYIGDDKIVKFESFILSKDEVWEIYMGIVSDVLEDYFRKKYSELIN